MLYNKSRTTIVFYRNENGRMPVKESLEALSEPDQAKAAAHISLLEVSGHTLGEPHVKLLRDKLRELRFKISSGQYRIIFFFHAGDGVVLVHTLQKRTQETPIQDLNLAVKRMKDWHKTYGGPNEKRG